MIDKLKERVTLFEKAIDEGIAQINALKGRKAECESLIQTLEAEQKEKSDAASEGCEG